MIGLTALLLGLLAMVDLGAGWNLDDGAYAIQVKVLDQTGEWAYPYRHVDTDPEHLLTPVSHATVTDTGVYPYVKHPLWIFVLQGSTRLVGGYTGFYLPSLAGAVLAAVTGGMLAERLWRHGAVGFWSVGLGPVVIHSQAMWAHTAAAALGGVLALSLVAFAQRRETRWHLAAAATAVAGLCAFRREGLLVAIAMVVTLALVARQQRSEPRELARGGSWVMVIGAAGALSTVASQWWSRRLAPGTSKFLGDMIESDAGFLIERIDAALRTLVDGLGVTAGGKISALLVVALSIGGGLALRSGSRRVLPAMLLLLGAAILSFARTAFIVPYEFGGLLVAVPVIAVGFVAFRWRERPLEEQALAYLVVLQLLAVLATQYPEGGSRDWGGRFLFPILVPATVLAVVTTARCLSGLRVPAPAQAVTALLAVSLLPTSAAWASTRTVRQNSSKFTTEIQATAAAPVIRVPRWTARASWRVLPEEDWLISHPHDAHEVLTLLRPGRTTPVAVAGWGAEEVETPSGYRREQVSDQIFLFHPV